MSTPMSEVRPMSEESVSSWELSSEDESILSISPRESVASSASSSEPLLDMDEQREQVRKDKAEQMRTFLEDLAAKMAWNPRDARQTLLILISEARRLDRLHSPPQDAETVDQKWKCLGMRINKALKCEGCSVADIKRLLANSFIFLEGVYQRNFSINPVAMSLNRQKMIERTRKYGLFCNAMDASC